MATEELTIGKNTFTVEIKEISQAELRFYPENPRVYSILNMADVDPTQEEIEEHMCKLDHVKQLKRSIESNGGLIDPLIVRGGDYTVLEGNSRLAAYRLLCKTNPAKWGKVKCEILPANISDSSIFALLGQYHIIGRKDWEPFEQAHYLYRRHQQTKLSIGYMADELGITTQKAEKMIGVIEFMIAHNDLNKRHWSHYEEYLKNASIKKYRDTSPDLDDVIAKEIKEDQIKEASDIRKIGEIAKVGDKQSKKLMQKISNGSISIYDAHEEIAEAGKLDNAIKRLKKFRETINNSAFEKQLMTSEETLNQAKFEVGKIIKRLEGIQKKLG